jgi:maltooligosyltrehalose trehalohydrolase
MNQPDIQIRKPGVSITPEGSAEAVLWAPFARKVEIKIAENLLVALEPEKYGYWKQKNVPIREGEAYKFVLDGTIEIPDPASLSQPDGVHGDSMVVDLRNFRWSDSVWKNLPISEYIIYELHTGTFTPEGTFAGIESKLNYLKILGVNAIEIMPVAQFPGSRNWGYDGVYPYAVQQSYGGAAALQKLVNACHENGIAVILDVVYNHLGPEGNYLGQSGPYFTNKYNTPWGPAINFDDAWCDGVRNYFIQNVLMWFRDFHIDALRLDAVHAIKDFSPVHILREIRQQVDQLMQQTGRVHYLIAELDLNDTKYIDPVEEKGYGMHAQWIDEFHHALRVCAGEQKNGYYADFAGIRHLARSYKNAYVYDGIWSPHRNKTFGVKAENNPGHQFVVFTQNHDHVGNRMLGERPSVLYSAEINKLMAGAVICSPFLPMLFMGEEYGETNPFQYFISHTDPALVEAVRKGRKAEFGAFQAAGEAPDPQAEETFNDCRLRWELPEKDNHRKIFQYYQALIKLRKEHPVLKNLSRKQLEVNIDEDKKLLFLHRWSGDRRLLLVMNFSASQQKAIVSDPGKGWFRILDSSDTIWGGPGSVAQDIVTGQTQIIVQPESFIIYSDNNA